MKDNTIGAQVLVHSNSHSHTHKQSRIDKIQPLLTHKNSKQKY